MKHNTCIWLTIWNFFCFSNKMYLTKERTNKMSVPWLLAHLSSVDHALHGLGHQFSGLHQLLLTRRVTHRRCHYLINNKHTKLAYMHFKEILIIIKFSILNNDLSVNLFKLMDTYWLFVYFPKPFNIVSIKYLEIIHSSFFHIHQDSNLSQ